MVELFLGHVGHEVRLALDAGVVVDDVQTAVLGDGVVDHAFDVFAPRNVGAERNGVTALPHDFGRGFLDLGLDDIGGRDLGAFGGENQRGGFAHAGAGAGYDGNLVGKFHRSLLPQEFGDGAVASFMLN